MRVGFTGTREGMTAAQQERFREGIARLKVTEFHHGACIGADAHAAHITASVYPLGIVIYAHRSTLVGLTADRAIQVSNMILDPKPPLVRNRDIVDACESLIAAPRGMTEEQRGGTWSTVRYARRQGKRIIIVWPDGTTTQEPTPSVTA